MVEVTDILYVVIVLVATGIFVFMNHYVGSTVIEELQATESINTTQTAVSALDDTQNALNMSDYVFMALFFGFILFILVSGWFISGHPVLIIVYFIVIICSVILGAVLSNTWSTLYNQPEFTSTAAQFPMTNHVFENFALYAGLMGVLAVVVVFGKPVLYGGNDV